METWTVTVASESPNVFQKDGALGHRAIYVVQNWLAVNVDMFRSKDFGPSDSPDLNPLGYCVWSVLKGLLARQGTQMSHLFAALKKACERFRPRMEVVIAADGE